MIPSPTRLVDPVHFFNHRGYSALTEDDLRRQIRELEAKLKTSEENCRTLANRLKAIAEARRL